MFGAELSLVAGLGVVLAHHGLDAPTRSEALWTELLEAGLLAAGGR